MPITKLLINEIICMLFYVWLLSPNNVCFSNPSRCYCVLVVHFFVLLSSIKEYHCEYPLACFFSPIDGHLAVFNYRLLWIKLLWIFLYMSFCRHTGLLLQLLEWIRCVLEHVYMLTLRNCQFINTTITFYNTTSNLWKFSLFYILIT